MEKSKIQESPTISVITINYNNCKGLEQTIISVEKQNYTNIEYIVIDGGSTDGSLQVILNHKNYISYWCSETDNGIYNAMNKGIEHITGEWCIFMNSGDLFYDQDVIKAFSKLNKNSNIGIIYGDVCLDFLYYGTLIKRYNNLSGNSRLGICHQASFIRSDLMKEKKYDETYKVTGDVDFFNKLLMQNYEFKYWPIIICKCDAYGISQKPSRNIMKEYHKVYSKGGYDYHPVKEEIRYFIKNSLYYLLPLKLYNYLAYLRIKYYCRKQIQNGK